MVLPEVAAAGGLGFYSNTGKTLVSPRLTPANTLALIIWGQSLGAGFAEGLYTPTHASACLNLNVGDGALYRAVDPLLGCNMHPGDTSKQANMFTRLADQLIGPFDRVILIPVAVGATSIGDWDTALYARINTALHRAGALGIEVGAVLGQIGESDNMLGTTAEAFVARFTSMRRKIAEGGLDMPWLMAKSTLRLGVTSTAVRSAIDELVDGVNIFAGPDTDTVTGAGSRYDGTHPSNAGANSMVALWYTALQAALGF